MAENEKNEKIEVEIKDSDKNDKENEQLKEELEQTKTTLALIAEKELARKKKALGLPENDPMTLQELKGYEAGLKANTRKEIPAGSSTLEGQGYYEQFQQQPTELGQKKYPDMESMIKDLRSMNTAESERYIQLLYQKMITDWRNAGHPSQVYPAPDSVTKKGVPEVVLDTAKENGESELAKWGIKVQQHGYARRNRDKIVLKQKRDD